MGAAGSSLVINRLTLLLSTIHETGRIQALVGLCSPLGKLRFSLLSLHHYPVVVFIVGLLIQAVLAESQF